MLSKDVSHRKIQQYSGTFPYCSTVRHRERGMFRQVSVCSTKTH